MDRGALFAPNIKSPMGLPVGRGTHRLTWDLFPPCICCRFKLFIFNGHTRASSRIGDSNLQVVPLCSTHPAAVSAAGHDVSADKWRSCSPLAGASRRDLIGSVLRQ